MEFLDKEITVDLEALLQLHLAGEAELEQQEELQQEFLETVE
jgi:hypothetical protein